MQNGLYVATSGMLMQEQRVSTISNNIANINTTAFKKDLAIFSEYRPVDNRIPQNAIQKTLYNKTINAAVKLDDVYTDFDAGHMKHTDNKLDIAIEQENAFFTVDTPWGLRFTRDGEFTLNQNSEVVTRDGHPLIDNNSGQAVVLPNDGSRIDIDKQGNIYSNNEVIGQIAMVEFDDLAYLQKVGRNLYAAVDILPIEAENAGVRQGYIEGSNINPVSEMVNMIDAMRGYEMYSKVVSTYDSINEQAANAIAKL